MGVPFPACFGLLKKVPPGLRTAPRRRFFSALTGWAPVCKLVPGTQSLSSAALTVGMHTLAVPVGHSAVVFGRTGLLLL